MRYFYTQCNKTTKLLISSALYLKCLLFLSCELLKFQFTVQESFLFLNLKNF